MKNMHVIDVAYPHTQSARHVEADALLAWLVTATVPVVVLLAAHTAGSVVGGAYCSLGEVRPPLVISGSWVIALLLGALVACGSHVLLRILPGRLVTRLYNAFAVMALSALFMHFGGGHGEAHFPFFMLLSFLVYYHDWRPIAFSCVVISAHHVAFFALEAAGWPLIVFSCLDKEVLAIHIAAGCGQGVVLGYIAERMRRTSVEIEAHRRRLNDVVDERTLALSEEVRRYQVLAGGLMDGFFVADLAGRMRDCNAIYCDMIGYRRDELLEMGIPDIEATHTAADVAARIKTIMAAGRERFDTQHRCKDGRILDVEVSVSRIEIRGEVLLYVVVHDISERKQREAELVALQRQAEQANAAKSEFLSRMSHELRTPLNAILGFSQLLETAPLSPQDAESVQEINKAGTRLLEQVNDVLDLSRIESGRLELSMGAVDIGRAIRQSVSQIAPLAARRGIRLAVQVAEAGLWGMADKRRLDQVLLNLLSNAIKYNREGGRIEAVATVVEGRVRIAVSDTGNGIAAENMDRLFRPFERFESAYEGIEGTGIGLALVKRLVEAMDGEIGVESVEGEGSTFWFTLAQVQGEAVTADRDGKAPVRASGRVAVTQAPPALTRRVLYIEDNPANRKLMEKLLQRLPDISLQLAEDGTSGLAAAQAQRPDLILLDINLPDMDGHAVLSHLRADERTRGIPVVAVTANAMKQDVARGMEAGFNAYVTKPIIFGVLRDTLVNILSESGAAEPPQASGRES